MGFIVLLMISLTSLVNMNLSLVTNQSNMFVARQNALLGMNLALGELQRTAGPDQRVTARSDISSANPVPNAYWTGVWKSTLPNNADATNPDAPNSPYPVAPSDANIAPSQSELMTWLISGNEGKDASDGDTLDYLPDTNLALSADFGSDVDNDAVYLVGASTLVQRGSDEAASVGLEGAVIAPKVPLRDSDANTTGHYAWWVGDEGIKARIAPHGVPTVLNATDTENEHRAFQLPSGSDPSVNTALATIYDRDEALLSNVKEYDSLNVLWGANDAGNRQVLNQHWHDLTPYANGLLTDTRWGGFRGDLTLAFENNAVFEKYFGTWNTDPDRFYFVDVVDHGYQAGGFPNWSILRSYYQLKDRDGVAAGRTRANNAAPLDSNRAVLSRFYDWSTNPSVPYKPGPNSTKEGYHSNSPLHALVARLQVTIGIRFIPTNDYLVPGDSSTPPTYTAQLLVKPLIGFYNPYNVRIDPPANSVSVLMNNLRWSFIPKITISVSGGTPVEFYFREVLSSDLLHQYAAGELEMIAPTFDLYPGETRLFGLWGDVTRSQYYAGGGHYTLKLTTAEHEGSSYDPESGYLILDLQTAYHASVTAAVEGEQGYQTVPSNDFGLSTDEKKELTVIATDTITISIDTTDTANVIYRHQAMPDNVTAANPHTQYFGPIVDNSNFDPADTQRTYANIPVSALIGIPGPLDNLITWGFWMRGANDNLMQSRLLVDHNIRAMTGSPQWDQMNNNYYASSIFTGEFEGSQLHGYISDPLANITADEQAGGRFSGFSGGSASSNYGGSARTVLFDVPREPLLSLGSLQHANVGRYTTDPTYIIGNSFAPARISDLSDIHSTGYSLNNFEAWDLSYLINQQLWDSYFFSTIPSNLTPANIDALRKGEISLPNHRLGLFHAWEEEILPEDLTNNLGTDESETFYEVATNFMIEGAFNINSTSEEAWAAFLASSRDLEIPSYDPNTAALIPGTTTSEAGAAFSRLMHPVDGQFGGADDAAFWRGYRALDDAQTRALATEIVRLIRQRGQPFSSLAEFVNRPLEDAPTNGPARTGILQQAINNAGLNDIALGTTYGAAPRPSGISHNQFNENKATSAFPGYLTQADVLQTLGPVMSARSDTFTIRSYGDSINPLTGEIDARAWCEAVVQRVPDETLHGQNLLDRDANRRYRIVSFRWLNKEEI